MVIADARRKAHLTQQQLADKLGVSRAAVANWEAGLARPDTDNAIALGREFGLTLDQIYQVEAKGGAAPDSAAAA